MTPYQLSKKFILAKTYTKAVITTRVNTFFMAGQLTEAEYLELIDLIETTYGA